MTGLPACQHTHTAEATGSSGRGERTGFVSTWNAVLFCGLLGYYISSQKGRQAEMGLFLGPHCSVTNISAQKPECSNYSLKRRQREYLLGGVGQFISLEKGRNSAMKSYDSTSKHPNWLWHWSKEHARFQGRSLAEGSPTTGLVPQVPSGSLLFS